jgi:hypothetical protein
MRTIESDHMITMASSPDTIAPPHRRRKNGFVFWTGRVLLGLLALLVSLAALGAIYQAVATAIDQRTYPPSGQLIDVAATTYTSIASAQQIRATQPSSWKEA